MGFGEEISAAKTVSRGLISFLCVICALLSGCFSAPDPPTKTATRNENTTSTGANAPRTSSDPDPERPPVDQPVNRQLEREARDARKRRTDNVPLPELPPTYRAAPENSRVTSQLNKDGSISETRIFDRHSALAKVEARWLPGQPKKLRITLKSGQVVLAETAQIQNLQTASSAFLVSLARQAETNPVNKN